MLRLGCHVEKAVPRLGPEGGGTLFEKGRSRNERLVRLSGGDLSEESRRGHGTGRKFRGRSGSLIWLPVQKIEPALFRKRSGVSEALPMGQQSRGESWR